MFHRIHTIAAVTFGLALSIGATLAHATTEQYYGRWTVSDDKPAYSSKGKLYKTIDMAPCGNDFCGISVSDNNSCGQTLFRFFTTHAADQELAGHGKWGAAKKKLLMGFVAPATAVPNLYLGLGESDMDLGGREGSTPAFQANYKNLGAARCTAK
jgi:hypothetical protein